MEIKNIHHWMESCGRNRLATAILALAHRWLILPPSRTNWQLGMKKLPPFWFVVLVLALSGHMQAQPLPDFQNDEVVQRIAFGSCLYPRPKKVAIFNGILRQKPDVFVFLGDNIYGDTTDMELLAEKWNALGAVRGFKKLNETSTILATWDDHDHGVNDGGKSFPMRLESERIFLDFFKEPADSPRRKREGVYGSYIFGPAGKRCQILLLDTRSFRDELPHLNGKPEPGRLPDQKDKVTSSDVIKARMAPGGGHCMWIRPCAN